jgi:hypothetical protein
MPISNLLDWDKVKLEAANADKVFIDTETIGLHGMVVLIQFSFDDGEIYLYEVWKEPIWKTLELIELFLPLRSVWFNCSFDVFHLAKLHTIWSLLPKDWISLENHIEEIALKYENAGQDGKAIKFKSVCDLMLWARKGAFQEIMARRDIRIRRVPTALAYLLARELEERVQLPDICFAKSKDPNAPRWRVLDRKTRDGNFDENFKDVCLKFNPHGGLKYLAEHALGVIPKYHYDQVEVPKEYMPPDKKLGFIPTALGMAPGGPDDEWRIRNNKGEVKGHAWPKYAHKHIEHWHSNQPAREYAHDDIVYTRGLYKIMDEPEFDDDDSVLAAMVGVVRWHGFEIDIEGIKKLQYAAIEIIKKSPVNINKYKDVRAYIKEAMNDVECLPLEVSTNKAVLKKISRHCFDKSEHGIQCNKCDGEGCIRCHNTGTIDALKPPTYDKAGGIKCGNHPAAERAFEILKVKTAAKEVELYSKLLRAKKFNPDFSVVGTLSTRMSGGDSGLNSQGIKGDKSIRSKFPLKWSYVDDDGEPVDMVLSGGDFDSYEVVLAATVYDDKDLNEALTKKIDCVNCPHGSKCQDCSGTGKIDDFDCKFCILEIGKTTGKRNCKLCGGKGWYRKKIHGLFGAAMYPPATYEDVLNSSGTSNDMYTSGKSGIFGMLYGGDWSTLVRNQGIDEEIAKEAEKRFFEQFPGIPKARQEVTDMFQSMKQIGGRQIVWNDPHEYIESFLGFRRSFKLENAICKALYDLARSMPKKWNECKIKVVRSMHKGPQSASGAVASAIYGAAFGLQSSNVRAAANHVIQSPGGQICKVVQRKIWDLQPVGIHDLIVAPLNIHDEIMSVNHPDYVNKVGEIVKETVESYRDRVPLLGMTWNIEQENWSEKKSGSKTLKISPPEMM